MTTDTPTAPRGMIQRIVALLLHPRSEWARIDAEPATVRGIMTGWVMPLAAIGPVAKLAGSQLFDGGRYGAAMAPRLTTSLTEAVMGYALSLLAIYLLSRLINGLGPNFGGKRDPVAAMKVAGYGATAAYLAGAFQLVHILEWFEVLGLYSLYLIFVGLPAVMHAPRKRVFVFTVVVMLTGIALTIALSLIVLASREMFTPEMPASAYNYTPPG